MEGFIVGVSLCVFVVLVGVGINATINESLNRNLIEQCELDLPRTEKCVLVAVPEAEAEKANE